MRLPDFLIIGAMKAGTTSLYRDLMTNPAVSMPYKKEPANLTRDEVLTDPGRRAYAALFEGAEPGQICGEASTGYTKLPRFPGVPRRALELLGPDLRAIYVVRDPVARIISHHFHEWTSKEIARGIDEAVRAEPRYIDYSRYAMQITPWIDTLGRDRVLVLRFETYVERRRESVDEVCRFLGVEPCGELIDPDAVYNPSVGKPVPRGPFQFVRQRAVYKRLLRPILSAQARQRLRAVFLPKATDRPDPPSPDTIEYILEQVADDSARLAGIMGHAGPLWDTPEAGRPRKPIPGR